VFLYSFLEFFEGHFKGKWIAQWTIIIIIIIIIIIYSVKIIKYGEREREIKYLYRKKIFEKLAPNWKSLFSCLLLLLWLWLLHIVGWLLYFIPS